MTTKHKGTALHIGLNHVDPDHYQGWDGELQGCQNDARDLQAIADGAGFDTTLPDDEQASAEAGARPRSPRPPSALASGDVFLLTYSGHGSQVPDKNGDENEDGYDETWVLYDRQLVDDELYTLWSKFAPGVRIVVLSDSCHSGTAIRETFAAISPTRSTTALSIPKPNGMRTMPKAQAREVYKANQGAVRRDPGGGAGGRHRRGRGQRVAAVGMPGQPDVRGREAQRPLHADAAGGVGRGQVQGRVQAVLRHDRRQDAAVAEPELAHGGAVEHHILAASVRSRSERRTMAEQLRDVVVVLPGIMGSVLRDAHGDDVWKLSAGSILKGVLGRGKAIKRLQASGRDR